MGSAIRDTSSPAQYIPTPSGMQSPGAGIQDRPTHALFALLFGVRPISPSLRGLGPGRLGWLPTQAPHRSGRTLPYPAPHLMISLRRSAHCGPLARGKTVPLLQSQEIRPRQGAARLRRESQRFQISRRLPQEFLETGEVPGDSVIPEVAFQFLTELLVLLRDRLVQVFTTPVR